ncbi:hypothetical protein FHR32_000641 [Streptosporangium album]|uniref:Uncharacterized protein n=1 Tax=Streptosporangium album TaxID=47479 RepID=A0A7W7RQJ0_9ACTN|nr:hypothetical protein [Streptosporangium album]MBB4936336.1 hypothetical protein [Streptosporangium album]
MATLHAQFDESGRLLDELEQYDQFAYYELSYDMGSGSFQHSEIVIATDPDELRWASDWMLKPHAEEEEPVLSGDLTLWTYSGKEKTSIIDLGRARRRPRRPGKQQDPVRSR